MRHKVLMQRSTFLLKYGRNRLLTFGEKMTKTSRFLAVAALFFLSVLNAHAQSPDASSLVSRYGTIVDRRDVGAGGLTAWTVEKGGRRVVLYTTADAQALFTGVVWDAATGRNLSDAFVPGGTSVPRIVQQPPEQTGVRVAAAFDGKFSGAVPASMQAVDSLAGIKEGRGGIADTLYIIVDPRCPYCRKAYNITRDYVKKGYSIKWIPVVALGDPANGVPLAATILQSGDKNIIERVLGKHEQIRTPPSKETEAALSTSLAFMFAAFERNGGQQAGVPVGFFIDRRSGKPRMMTGVSEKVVLEDIFGKL